MANIHPFTHVWLKKESGMQSVQANDVWELASWQSSTKVFFILEKGRAPLLLFVEGYHIRMWYFEAATGILQ